MTNPQEMTDQQRAALSGIRALFEDVADNIKETTGWPEQNGLLLTYTDGSSIAFSRSQDLTDKITEAYTEVFNARGGSNET